MRKVLQSIGVALMVIAAAFAVFATTWQMMGVGCSCFLLSWVIFRGGFQALVQSSCVFALMFYLAAPFIWMYEPDYYFSAAFDVRFFGAVVVMLVMLSLRYAVIPALFPRVYHYIMEGALTLADLAPEKGLTVEEIQKNNTKPQVKFLYGEPDKELVERWRCVASEIANVSKKYYRFSLYILIVLVAWPIGVYIVSGGPSGARERDIERLWETEIGRENLVVANSRAYNAARRVFSDKRFFRGLTKNEALMAIKKSNQNAKYKLGKARYEHLNDETLAVISDGYNSLRFIATYDDRGRIMNSWVEEYMTMLAKDVKE